MATKSAILVDAFRVMLDSFSVRRLLAGRWLPVAAFAILIDKYKLVTAFECDAKGFARALSWEKFKRYNV